MKFFLDSASLEEAERWAATGLVAGVTTNPTIIAKTAGGRDPIAVLECLAEYFDVVSVQVTGPDDDPKRYLDISDAVLVKIPICEWGLRKIADADPRRLNLTGITSLGQALVAATYRPAIASVFWNRTKEDQVDPARVVFALETALAGDERSETKILAGSIRSATDVLEAHNAGVEIVTCSPAVLEEVLRSPATSKILGEWYGSGA